MNSVIKSGEAERISSLQIAEVTGKQHKNIMRDIRGLLKQGISRLNFELAKYNDNQGKPRQCYLLTKKGCLILASGYDALLREKIIDRLEELETQARLSQSLRTEEVLLSLESRVRALETSRRLSADAGEQILTPGIEHQAAYGLGGKGLYVYDYNEQRAHAAAFRILGSFIMRNEAGKAHVSMLLYIVRIALKKGKGCDFTVSTTELKNVKMRDKTFYRVLNDLAAWGVIEYRKGINRYMPSQVCLTESYRAMLKELRRANISNK